MIHNKWYLTANNDLQYLYTWICKTKSWYCINHYCCCYTVYDIFKKSCILLEKYIFIVVVVYQKSWCLDVWFGSNCWWRTDGRKEGRTDGRTDGRKDGRTKRRIEVGAPPNNLKFPRFLSWKLYSGVKDESVCQTSWTKTKYLL